MQTFLPDEDFVKCAKILDNRRLFKQVVEARQILATLGVSVPKVSGGLVSPIKNANHPAILMWKGYEEALIEYHDAMLIEVVGTRKFNTNMKCLLRNYAPYREINFPWWLDDPRIFISHQSNLLRKNSKYYSKFGWTVDDNIPYFWPVTR